MRLMMRILSCILAVLSSLSVLSSEPVVQFVTPSIVRVQWTVGTSCEGNNTGVCVYDKQKVKVTESNIGGFRKLESSHLIIYIDNATGAISFVDRSTGRMLLAETGRRAETVVQEKVVYDEKSARIVETANGKITVKDVVRRDTIGTSTRYMSHFYSKETKALYGLGAHMEDYMNLLGKTLWLTQHNMKVHVPMLLSPQGYGLLFDAGCAMKFSSSGNCFTMQLEAARQLDYYFIKGDRMQDIVAGYHHLTGRVQLLPLYAFGYVQSKERYRSSEELISTVKEYRKRHVPLDVIVQDWNYWSQGWGYLKMDRKSYPDPKALADSLHALDAKLMVSIWPNPQACPQQADFKAKGYLLEHSTYNAFSEEARRYYWKYVNDEFFAKGFDAWWCDCSEPVDGDWRRMTETVDGKPYGWYSHEKRWQINKDILSEMLGAERSSLYSLYHAKGIYENQRHADESKRVLNLTRSGYAGQQRYATVVWNGDTYASWDAFKRQIPSGLNYMATGNPYWTVDVGAFFVKNDNKRWFYTGEFPEGVADDAYREYYTRMFQWATFLPMLRSHGTDTPREIWRFGEPGTRYYDAILKMIRLRYSMLPYIYSMAARQTFDSYSMVRLLAFDYPDDENVYDIKDEYLFGNILVCPVTEPIGRQATRKVYLPEGNEWIDFWTDRRYDGGQWIEVSSLIDRLPLYVKAGSIIPVTDVVEYSSAQTDKPVTALVYPGRDASFTLYQDAGDGYAFEQGDYSTATLLWNEGKRNFEVRTKGFPRKIIYKVVEVR